MYEWGKSNWPRSFCRIAASFSRVGHKSSVCLTKGWKSSSKSARLCLAIGSFPVVTSLITVLLHNDQRLPKCFCVADNCIQNAICTAILFTNSDCDLVPEEKKHRKLKTVWNNKPVAYAKSMYWKESRYSSPKEHYFQRNCEEVRIWTREDRSGFEETSIFVRVLKRKYLTCKSFTISIRTYKAGEDRLTS